MISAWEAGVSWGDSAAELVKRGITARVSSRWRNRGSPVDLVRLWYGAGEGLSFAAAAVSRGCHDNEWRVPVPNGVPPPGCSSGSGSLDGGGARRSAGALRRCCSSAPSALWNRVSLAYGVAVEALGRASRQPARAVQRLDLHGRPV